LNDFTLAASLTKNKSFQQTNTKSMSEDQLVAPPPQHCPGIHSEQAGKSKACEGCPNQKICATAPKGPDPGSHTNKTEKKNNS
jgi:hypothetical protein